MAVTATALLLAVPARADDRNAAALAGAYAADVDGSAFQRFELGLEPGTPSRPVQGQAYFRYRATRADGTADAGTWSVVVTADGGGYLTFESGQADFPNGKRSELLAIYRVATVATACGLATRPTDGPRWTVAPEQRYSRSGCKSPPLVGAYQASSQIATFRSLILSTTPATSARPEAGRSYYHYRGVRADGAADEGTWSIVTYADGGGYLMLESSARDFASGGRDLQLAVYDVGKGCSLSTRPTTGKGWNTRSPEVYAQLGCVAQ